MNWRVLLRHRSWPIRTEAMDVTDTRRLPTPVTDIWDWQMRARCRSLDTAMFFHTEGERGRARLRHEERAKAVCRTCPVIDECRRHALAVREPYGVWGGMSPRERAVEAAA